MTGPDALIALCVIACLLVLLTMWVAVALVSDAKRANQSINDSADIFGADWGGEGSFETHGQPNITGAQRDHV
jgi:hypothetical protein